MRNILSAMCDGDATARTLNFCIFSARDRWEVQPVVSCLDPLSLLADDAMTLPSMLS
jgi:hypothetical protein